MEIRLRCPKCDGPCTMRVAQRVLQEVVIFGKCHDCDIPLKWPMNEIEDMLFPERRVH